MRRIFLTIGIVAMAAVMPVSAAHSLTPAQSTAMAAKARSEAMARARVEADTKARTDALAAARAKADATQMQTKAAVEIFVRSQEAARVKGARMAASPYVVANPARSELANPVHATPKRMGAERSVTPHRHAGTPRPTPSLSHGTH